MMRILALCVSQLVTRKCCQGMFITQLITSYCHLAQSLYPFPNHFIKEAHRIGQGKCNGIDGQPMTNQPYAFAHQQVPSNLDQHCYYFCNIEFTKPRT